ncbi:MAG: PP2C family protein-serine/threonine phosphatase [Coriobacteriales bacterium]|nr:PP2C family protein-serine/threonine phosphatase [Coriobacteriales bacterium]
MFKKIRTSATVKSIAGIVGMLILFSVIVGVIGYNSVSDSLLEQYADGAFIAGYTAQSSLDGDRIDEYANSGGETQAYKEAWAELDQICNATNSTFVYVIRPDLTDYAHITFIFSTINRESKYSVYDFGYVRETTNDDYKTKYKKLYDGVSDRELVIRDKGYIETDSHITAMVPIKTSDGKTTAILCVQRQMDQLATARQGFLNSIAITLVVLALIVSVMQSIYLRKMLIIPIKAISEEAGRFARENVLPEKKLTESIRTKDEIGDLAGSIDQMEEQVDDYVRNLTQVTRENERISTELGLAAQIQEGMLPNIFPYLPEREEFDIYAKMDPAKEVGGDFYDFFMLDDDHLCLYIADVSGKGVPAALFMMASKMILGVHARNSMSPAEILEQANDTICESNPEEMFFSIWLGILELSTGKLTAANAGHEYPLLQKPDGTFEVIKDKHGFVIGGIEGMMYMEYEIQMEPGSKVLVYTDGVPEATDANNELYGMERLIDNLNANPEPSLTPKGVLTKVRTQVDTFVQDAEQFDDLTMVCVEYRA